MALFGATQRIELRAEEPRRAVVSMEMEMSGEYVVPHINGVEYYNKPPVFNWVMATCFKLFGSYSEWVVRLPGLLSLILLAFLSYRFAIPELGKEKAVWAGIFVLCSADILFYGSVNSGEIDLFYALLCFLQVMVIYKGMGQQKWWQLFLLSYLLAAVGFLTKGMPSLAFQAITLLVWFSYRRRFVKLLSVSHLSGILLFIAIVGGYFLIYDKQADAQAFLIRQFKEASQRTAAESSFFSVFRQFFSFPFQFLILMLPWSLFLLPWFTKGSRALIQKNSLLTFSVIFILANILIYWIAGEFKARYYYMFFPFAAFLLASKIEVLSANRAWSLTFRILGSLIAAFAILSPFFTVEQWSIAFVLSLTLIVIATAFFSMLLWRTRLLLISLACLMMLGRISFNVGILEATQQNADDFYRQTVSQMMEACSYQSVHLFGEPHVFSSDASLGPITLDSAVYRTAPLIAYQIPYYVARSSGEVMQFEPKMTADQYYLVPDDLMQEEWESLFKLRDHWQKRDYHLVLAP